MTILFQRIKQVCAENELSLYRVEKDAKLTPSSLVKWSESMPSGDKIMRVANVLDVSVDYLLGNCDNPKSHKQPPTEAPIALELSKAISTLSASVSACFEQTDEHVKRLLQANGIDITNKFTSNTE